MTQPMLFDALAEGHAVTVDTVAEGYHVGELVRTLDWLVWDCSCGATSRGRNRWSHREMAVRQGQHHTDREQVAA